jgi:hypothetical protein
MSDRRAGREPGSFFGERCALEILTRRYRLAEGRRSGFNPTPKSEQNSGLQKEAKTQRA